MSKLAVLLLSGALLLPAISGTAEASGGCGPYRHRGPYGGCRPGGQFGFPGGGFHRGGYHYHYHYHYHFRR